MDVINNVLGKGERLVDSNSDALVHYFPSIYTYCSVNQFEGELLNTSFKLLFPSGVSASIGTKSIVNVDSTSLISDLGGDDISGEGQDSS